MGASGGLAGDGGSGSLGDDEGVAVAHRLEVLGEALAVDGELVLVEDVEQEASEVAAVPALHLLGGLEADLLVHVVDMSHPFHDNQIEVVSKTLAEIGAGNIPVILCLNKIDRVDPAIDLDAVKGRYREQGFERVVFISATSKQNVDDLKRVLFEEVKKKHLTFYPNYVSGY